MDGGRVFFCLKATQTDWVFGLVNGSASNVFAKDNVVLFGHLDSRTSILHSRAGITALKMVRFLWVGSDQQEPCSSYF